MIRGQSRNWNLPDFCLQLADESQGTDLRLWLLFIDKLQLKARVHRKTQIQISRMTAGTVHFATDRIRAAPNSWSF